VEDTFWESEQETFPGAKNYSCGRVLDNTDRMIGWVILWEAWYAKLKTKGFIL